MLWVTTGNMAAIIDRKKVLAADALEAYMVYIFDKLEAACVRESSNQWEVMNATARPRA